MLDASKNDRVLTVLDEIAKKYLELPEIQFEETIAKLTPIRNSERLLDQLGHWYLHHLHVFGEERNTDKTFEKANNTVF